MGKAAFGQLFLFGGVYYSHFTKKIKIRRFTPKWLPKFEKLMYFCTLKKWSRSSAE